MKILITGATGLIGNALVKKLLFKGYQVTILSRNKNAYLPGVDSYFWDPSKQEIAHESIGTADAIINLAGAGIADKRWSASYKQMILSSRIQATKLLVDKLATIPNKVKTLINASAVGYYGANTNNDWMTETSPAGNDYLADVVRKWEMEAFRAKSLRVRTIALRTGIVLSALGGALPKLALPVRLGLGAAFGTGNQYISWIAMEDLINMYVHALENPSVEGIYNAVSPQPVTNLEFTKKLAKHFRRPLFLPNIPEWAIKLLVGEMADTLVGGNLASADKIVKTGFQFEYAELENAIKHYYDQPKAMFLK